MTDPLDRGVADLSGAAGAHRESALARLRELVELDSPSGEPELLGAVRDTLAERLDELGLSVTTVPGPAGDHLLARADGTERMPIAEPGRKAILLVGHYDTVWPAGEASRRPFSSDPMRARGPGVLDMKGGLVVIELALELIRQRPLALAQPVEVVIVADEEISSPDGRRVVLDAATRAAAAIGLEPSFADGALKTARRGVTRVRLEVSGREAHSGLDAARGISAIDELLDQLQSLRELIDRTDGVELNIGQLEGGSRPNVIAGRAVAELSFRASLTTGEQAIHDWREAVTSRRPGAVVRAELVATRPVWEATEHPPLADHVDRVAAALGQRLSGRPAGGAGDTNLTAAAGVPSIDGLGPRGEGAHAPGEYVEIESLLRRAELLAALLITPLSF